MNQETAGSPAKTPRAKGEKSYAITALSRAINVLKTFSADRPQLTLNEVVAATNLPKTTVFRLLSALMEHDFISFDEASGKYSLGFALLQMGEIRRGQTNVNRTVMPIVQQIRDATDESVVFSIRVQDERVHVDAMESRQLLRRTAVIGGRASLHTGASSKALLSGMADQEIDDYIVRTNASAVEEPQKIDADELWHEIEQIRRLGYAESQGEVRPGGRALAAPIRGHGGVCVGAINVMMPNDRYTPEHRAEVIAVLIDGVRRASSLLGYRG